MEGSFKKVGIVIIGDELLKGQVTDTNSSFLCKRFHAIGVKVGRITTVPDDVAEIAEEVSRFSEKFDIVVTTGGIGPTHDDITYEAIALALKDRIVLNAEMAEVIRSYFHGSNKVETNPALKMALIPQNSKLIYIMPKTLNEHPDQDGHNGLQEANSPGGKKPFPIVQVKNVYVLPGIREWLEHAFNHLENIFKNPAVNIYTMVMFLKTAELNIVKELNNAVQKFQKQVIFGSYANNAKGGDYQTKITLESTSLDEVTSAYSYLSSIIPKECLHTGLINEDAELVYALTEGVKSLSTVLRHSLEVIETAMTRYETGEIYLSFNGGKDCTALLHLVWAVNRRMKKSNAINAIYIKAEESFPEVDKFICRTAEMYNLNLITSPGPIKTALEKLYGKNGKIKAIFMGTRRTDPYAAELEDFQLCDKDWPPIMRVNPILDWSYGDVWNFLRVLNVPYCCLYDEGYTSIGSPRNTQRNPALRVSSSEDMYNPAYTLKDYSLERRGRS